MLNRSLLPARLFLSTSVALFVTALPAPAKPVVFVEDGKLVAVAEQAGGWKQTDAGLQATGKGALLLAGQGVGEGDFRVRAELTITGLAGSAATFVLGDSHFGFASANNDLFLTGENILAGTHGTPVARTASFVSEGVPFVFEVARNGDQLAFAIDGKPVHRRPVTTGPVGRIGLMPWRATMTVKSFQAEGGLGAELARYQPPHLPVVKKVDGVEKTVLLPPKPINPRNSEGDFIALRDGRIMFVYTHFTGGGGDHAAAHLAARFSNDRGKTWSVDDVVVVPNEGGWNVMSASLLRLDDGRIALFYLRKNSTKDCRPVMRLSTDEGRTWGQPTLVIPDSERDYYVLNNDRVIQLTRGPHKGRLLAPVSQHSFADNKFPPGKATCYFSDDRGQTWRRSASTMAHSADDRQVNFQEPGVVELKDGKVLMYIRTAEGSQFLTTSSDGGQGWDKPRPSNIASPLSPASIERIPSTGDLLLLWNDHRNVAPDLKGKRTPYAAAISRDEGKTWVNTKVLEDDPRGWYCYTAIEFVDGEVLLGHCAGTQGRGHSGLDTTQITRFPVEWLYR